jgi:hypothetical protein
VCAAGVIINQLRPVLIQLLSPVKNQAWNQVLGKFPIMFDSPWHLLFIHAEIPTGRILDYKSHFFPIDLL